MKNGFHIPESERKYMMYKKILAFLTAAVMTTASAVSCEKKSGGAKDDDIDIVEVEPQSGSEEINEEISADSYPDYPISYPEIEKKRTGDFYEAEDAHKSKGLRIEPSEEEAEEAEDENGELKRPYSGDGYVTGFKSDGSTRVVFDVKAPSNQHYDLSFSISSRHQIDCIVSVNGVETANFKTIDDDEFTLITLYGVFLTKGKSTIEIRPSNGNIKLDYLKVSNNTSLSTIKYDADDKLSNKEAGKSAKKLMKFLTDNYGKYTISGQYVSDETNKETDLIYQTTGKYPVIRFSAMHNSGNSFDSTFRNIDACADWYRKGGIVGLMWYWEAPSEKKPSVYAKETDFRLSDAVTDIDIATLSQEEIRGLYGEGRISGQCYGLILDIDNMAGQLMSLKNKGVPVLWRPLHEASGDWFWWGADGTDAYKWLWNLMYKRYTEYFELDNLIWVWNGQSEESLVDKKTFDIASLDIYLSPEKEYGSRYEQFLALQKIVGKDKLIALSECSSVPDIDKSFRDNAVWSFFGMWYEKYICDKEGGYSEQYTKKDALVRAYNSDGVLSLDEYIRLCGGEELVPDYEEKTTEASASASTEASAVNSEAETSHTETDTQTTVTE